MAQTREQLVEMLLGDTQLAIETSVRAFVAELQPTEKHKLALAEMCYRMARKLDRDAGMATAAIARELRETLGVISGESNSNDDEFWKHFESGISGEVRNTKKLR